MKIKVQKYGGSSVADREKLRHVARRLVEEHRAGSQTVCVVSAMGDTTDELLQLAQGVCGNPDRRELDMLLSAGERVSTALLALAVQDLGVDAISLTGAQSGIVTSGRHFNARIEEIDPGRVHAELADDKVVIVAGFQGASPGGETTTLGRGGSDTSAVALASALDAEICEIFSDVEGVFSADPRIVDEPTPLDVIDYEEMLEMARHGAGVLSSEAVELASELGVTLRAAATFGDGPGTLVTAPNGDGSDDRPEPAVKGVACHRELIRLSMKACSTLHQEVLEAGGSPEVYLGSAVDDERHELFVRAEAVADERALTRALADEFGSRVEVSNGIGSVSAVGRGVGRAEVPRQKIRRLGAYVGCPDDRHVASDHALTCLLDSHLVDEATRALHGALVQPAIPGADSGASA